MLPGAPAPRGDRQVPITLSPRSAGIFSYREGGQSDADPYEIDRRAEEFALKAAVTPQHAAFEAAVDADGAEDDAVRRRRRIQHDADPYAEAAEIPEVHVAELGKRYSQAFEVPAGYLQPGRIDPEEFRRAPLAGGQAAYSPGYQVPERPVPVPPSALAPGGR